MIFSHSESESFLQPNGSEGRPRGYNYKRLRLKRKIKKKTTVKLLCSRDRLEKNVFARIASK